MRHFPGFEELGKQRLWRFPQHKQLGFGVELCNGLGEIILAVQP
jgi:hypothetical protein